MPRSLRGTAAPTPASRSCEQVAVNSAVSVAESVAAIVLGVVAVNVVIWIPVILWFRRRPREARARLAAAIDGETVICPPEKGNYRGSTAPGYPMVNNNAVIALTDRKLICITVTGKEIQVPVES